MLDRQQTLTFVFLVGLIALGLVVLAIARPTPVEITLVTARPTAIPITATPAPINVYVSGAVLVPNLVVSLPAGSRVSDALAAVGGATGNADMTGVNLAALLHDGDQVHVPERGAVSITPTPSGGLIVHINSDSAEVIALLPDIGAELAARIVAYRQANGDFKTLQDLDAVDGIGETLLARIAPYVHFD